MRRSSVSPRRQRAASGFTLLEVLGAVAILGIWYVILAGIAIQGLRTEGESERRIRASLLADEVMAELEAQTARGAVPQISSSEDEREEFIVRLNVENLDLPLAPAEDAARDPGETGPIEGSLFAPGPDGTAPLRSMRVEVAWIEGASERSVARTTYAFDLESVRSLLEGLEGAEGNDTEEGDDLEEDRDDDEDDFDDDEFDEEDDQ